MLQLKNSTPFASVITLFPDQNGIDTLFLIVKATFRLGDVITVAEEQVAPVLSDIYWREPNQSSLKYASEAHIGKPTTDVVLVGQAWPANSAKAQQLDVTLSVAEREKTVRVFGNRIWRNNGGAISPAEPFEYMQRLVPDSQRSNHRYLRVIQLERKRMLFEYLLVSPAFRSVELCDQK